MKTDLVLSPFGGSVPEMVAAAQATDAAGFDGVWTYDHVSGLVAGSGWSRDPFVVLGAIGAVTQRVTLGVLVANMVNRHPTQLAAALNSLQSLTSGRVRCGIGAGASPGSAYAAEHDAVGRVLAPPTIRRAILAETIDALRAIWRGDEFIGDHYRAACSMAVTDGSPAPPIIVGATTKATIAVACEHADGVNIQRRRGDDEQLAEQVAFARRQRPSGSFDIGVFDAFHPDHELGGDPAPLEALGVDRRTLHVSAPYPLEDIERVGKALS